MADKFAEFRKGLDSPLTTGEVAAYSSVTSPPTDHEFATLPRALNCSAAGVLKVDLGALTNQSITVVAGLNPYRVSKIYHTGSAAMTVVGMW